MANDGSLISTLEQWFVDTLAALTYGGKAVFKTADVWKHQISASEGGMEKVEQYAPFAFVSSGDDDAAREGDNDLRQVVEFVILIGQSNKSPGVARKGDANDLGTNMIRDLVIKCFETDNKHPGGEFACDEIYYTGGVEVLDSRTRHLRQLRFETSFLGPVPA